MKVKDATLLGRVTMWDRGTSERYGCVGLLNSEPICHCSRKKQFWMIAGGQFIVLKSIGTVVEPNHKLKPVRSRVPKAHVTNKFGDFSLGADNTTERTPTLNVALVIFARCTKGICWHFELPSTFGANVFIYCVHLNVSIVVLSYNVMALLQFENR